LLDVGSSHADMWKWPHGTFFYLERSTMMNILLDTWATTMWRASWQGGLVVLVVWLICRLLPSMPARFQCWLWRLAVLKFMVVLVVPWFLNVPLLPAHRAPERITEVTTFAPTMPIHQEHLDQTSVLTTPTPMSIPTPLPMLSVMLFLGWTIGVGWSLALLLTAWRDARRLGKQGHTTTCTSLIEQLTVQGRLFGFRSLPRLLEVEGGGSPMLIGILRPTIVVPAETLGRLSMSEQKVVLGHELAHTKRGDVLWSTAAAFVQAAFFFHPLVWLNRRRLNLLQEVAADELAIAQQQHDPASYGGLLVSVVSKLGPARLLPRMSVETVGSVETLKTRLIAMNRIGRMSRRVVIASVFVLVGVVFIGLVPWRLVAAEPTPGDSKSLPVAEKSPATAGHAAIKPTTDEARVIAEIEKLGGKVTVDEKSPGKPVTGVTFEGSKVTDAALAYLKGLATLRTLNLGNTQVTDAGLAHLKGLEQLQWLNLSGTKVTDAGLNSLKRLAHLQALHLTTTKVTDAGLENINGLMELRLLAVADTKVTDAGLEHLKVLVKLFYLNVAGTKVSGTGLECLEGLAQLQVLNLWGTQVTDAGLVHLRRLNMLKWLGLSHISDAGLENLKGLTNLRVLWLKDSTITDAGVTYLEGLPDLGTLRLISTQVTDKGLERLNRLNKLRSLSLIMSKTMTDDKLACLRGLTTLQSLTLTGPGITDAGLRQLDGFTMLRSLELMCPRVTDAGITNLQKSLPNCKIVDGRSGTPWPFRWWENEDDIHPRL